MSVVYRNRSTGERVERASRSSRFDALPRSWELLVDEGPAQWENDAADELLAAQEPTSPNVERPAKNAPRDDWEAYALAVDPDAADTIEGATKTALIAAYGDA